MLIYRDISIFWSLIQVFVVFLLLFESRFTRGKTIGMTCGIATVVIFFNVLGVRLFGTVEMGKYFLISCALPCFLFFLGMSKYRDGRFFFTFCIAGIFSLWIFSVTNILCFFMEWNYFFMLISRVLLFFLLECYIYKHLKKPYMQAIQLVKKGWMLFSSISALLYLLLAVMGSWPDTITNRLDELPAFLLLLLMIPVVYFSIFRTVGRQVEMYHLKENDRVLRSQVQALQNQIASISQSEENTKILRHDMRHYMQNLSVLLSEGDVKKALELIGRVSSSLDKAVVPKYCENIALNAVLAFQIQKAEQEGITVTSRFQMPKEITVDEVELSVVFANALENARNACRKLPWGSRKTIDIKCIANPFLVFEIANTYQGELIFDKKGLPMTEKEGHGIGMRSIEAFVEKHHAMIDCQGEDGIFRIRILLYN